MIRLRYYGLLWAGLLSLWLSLGATCSGPLTLRSSQAHAVEPLPNLLWERDSKMWQPVQPLTDRVLIATVGGVQALDALTGEHLWKTVLMEGQPIQKLLCVGNTVVAVVDTTQPAIDAITLAAVDMNTGQRLWSADGYVDHTDAGVKPFVTPQHVYVGDDQIKLHALNSVTGQVTWAVGLGERAHLRPLASDGLVFYTVADGALVGADDRTGQPLWQTYIEGRPIVVDSQRSQRPIYGGYAKDGLLVVWHDPAVRDGRLVSGGRPLMRAFETTTGKLLWTLPYIPYVNSPLLYHDQTLYVMTRSSSAGAPTLYAIDTTNGNLHFAKVLARETEGKIKTHDGQWQAILEPAGYPTAIVDDLLILNGAMGSIYGIQRRTGAIVWHHPEGSAYYKQTIIHKHIGYFAPREVGFDRVFSTTLKAIDLRTGQLLWSRTRRGGPFYELHATEKALIVRGLERTTAISMPD